jgi:hypothetical protein
MINIHSINKKKLILSLAAGTTILFILNLVIFLRDKTSEIKPQTLPETSFPSIHQPNNVRFSYAGDIPKLQTSASVYEVTDKIIATREIAEEYAEKFNLSNLNQTIEGISGNLYIFTGEITRLYVYSEPLKLVYDDFNESTANRVSEEEFIDKAVLFLNRYLELTSPLSLGNPYLTFLTTTETGESYIRANSLHEAKNIQVDYNFILDGLPLIDKNLQSSPALILFNPDGTIKKATITIFPNQLVKVGTASLTNPREALGAINAGEGVISKFYNPDVGYSEIESRKIINSTFHSLELVYVYDYDSDQVHPFYRFIGIAEVGGETLEVEALITALSQEVFIK